MPSLHCGAITVVVGRTGTKEALSHFLILAFDQGHKLLDWFFNTFEFLTRGNSTRELEQWLDVPVKQLRATDLGYSTFDIKKRSGKTRKIDSPNPNLKALQRTILRKLLQGLKVHESAVGFEKGKSIVTAAKQHVDKQIVLNFDIVDFFPSISDLQIKQYFRAIGWNLASANLLTRLVTYKGRLPQGAPTSPRLSNLVNYGMDYRLKSYVAQFDGAYTLSLIHI